MTREIETTEEAKAAASLAAECKQARMWLAGLMKRLEEHEAVNPDARWVRLASEDWISSATDFEKSADWMLSRFAESNYPRSLGDEWPGARLKQNEVV